MSEREPWLGHRDLCSLQWSDECDCVITAPPCGCIDSLWNGECDCAATKAGASDG